MKKISDFDFEGGKQVTGKELEDWEAQIMDKLQDIDPPAFSYIMGGNGAVIGVLKMDYSIDIFIIPKGFRHKRFVI